CSPDLPGEPEQRVVRPDPGRDGVGGGRVRGHDGPQLADGPLGGGDDPLHLDLVAAAPAVGQEAVRREVGVPVLVGQPGGDGRLVAAVRPVGPGQLVGAVLDLDDGGGVLLGGPAERSRVPGAGRVVGQGAGGVPADIGGQQAAQGPG